MVCVTLVSAHAVPKQVIIIRHAEKTEGTNYLSSKGHERAGALPYYFSKTPMFNDPSIKHIFAAAPAKKHTSMRSIQTCTPIAQHYQLPLNTDFKTRETDKIAHEILNNPIYDNSTVLVCWSHGHIRPLVLALRGEDPGKWEDNVFDQVYLMTYEGSKKPTLQKILQKLMFGDRATFGDK